MKKFIIIIVIAMLSSINACLAFNEIGNSLGNPEFINNIVVAMGILVGVNLVILVFAGIYLKRESHRTVGEIHQVLERIQSHEMKVKLLRGEAERISVYDFKPDSIPPEIGDQLTSLIEKVDEMEVSEIQPSPKVYFNTGIAHSYLGDYRRAKEACLKATEGDYTNPEYFMLLGDVCHKLKDWEQAITAYTRVIRLSDETKTLVEAYNYRGIARFQLDKYEESLEDFNNAIRIDPNHAESYSNRGAVKDSHYEFEEAIADLNIALSLQPECAEAYNNRANARKDIGNYEGAMKDYDRAILLKPEYAEAHYNRANLKFVLGDYDDCIVDYDKAIELNPDYAIAYNNRGNTRDEMGDFQGAIEDYNKAIDLKPDYCGAYYNRGLLFRKLKQYDNSIHDLEKALEFVEDCDYRAIVYYHIGLAYLYSDNGTAAINALEKAIEEADWVKKAIASENEIPVWLKEIPEKAEDLRNIISDLIAPYQIDGDILESGKFSAGDVIAYKDKNQKDIEMVIQDMQQIEEVGTSVVSENPIE